MPSDPGPAWAPDVPAIACAHTGVPAARTTAPRCPAFAPAVGAASVTDADAAAGHAVADAVYFRDAWSGGFAKWNVAFRTPVTAGPSGGLGGGVKTTAAVAATGLSIATANAHAATVASRFCRLRIARNGIIRTSQGFPGVLPGAARRAIGHGGLAGHQPAEK